MRHTPIGYDFVCGPRATGYEWIRKARKSYECEGCSINAEAVDPGTWLSPLTGSIVFEGFSKNCSKIIKPGDLHVVQEYTGEHAQDFGAAYRYTHRTCLACALEFGAIRHSRNGES